MYYLSLIYDMITNNMLLTNDKIIRTSLKKVLDKELEEYRKDGYKAEIFEELGVQHGASRIDFAIINGVMRGYEIKSDKDTLIRLPYQVKQFNAVFDKLILVVGKRHLYKAMHIVPEWWGIIIAKINTNGDVVFQTIREADYNKQQTKISIARLLWRSEALKILEERKKADGVRYKSRESIYERLVNISDINTLKKIVSTQLISREDWRSDSQLILNDD